MHLYTNEIDTTSVRSETFQGDEHLVAPVALLQSMYLNAPWAGPDGAYLPEREAAKSARSWNGEPVTLNHPTNADGEAVTANSPEMAEKTVLGRVFNAQHTGDGTVRGEVWLNVSRIESMGGEAERVLNELRDGDTVEVSTGYLADKLPAGSYDGDRHAEVQGNIRPDHLAVLPNQTGRCSIKHGCGAGATVAANEDSDDATGQLVIASTPADDPTEGEDGGQDTMHANTTVGGISFSGTADGSLDESAIPNEDYEDHYVFDGDTKSASSFPLVDADGRLRRQNVLAAFRFRADAPDTEQLVDVLEAVNDEFDDPPINPESLEEAMTGNSGSSLASGIGNVLSFLGLGGDSTDVENGNEPAESGVDAGEGPSGDSTPATPGADMTERDQLIDDLVENHDFKRDSLEGMGDACLQRTHESFSGEEEDTTDEQTQNNDLPESVVTDDDLSEFKDELLDELAQNEQQEQREELVDEITANSDRYDADDLEETPVSVLEDIRADVVGNADFSAARGAGAKPTTNADDVEPVRYTPSQAQEGDD